MLRPTAIVLLVLMGLGLAAQQALACGGMSGVATAAGCCHGDGAGNGRDNPCDSDTGLPALACSPAACTAALDPAPGSSLQPRQTSERLANQPLDLPVSPHISLANSVNDQIEPLSIAWVESFSPRHFSAAPAAYLLTLRLRL